MQQTQNTIARGGDDAFETSSLSSTSSSSLHSDEQQQQAQQADQYTSARFVPASTFFTRMHDQLWRWYIFLLGATPGSFFQTWERTVIMSLAFFVSALFWWSICFHLPSHLQQLFSKSQYYLFGIRPASARAAAQLMNHAAGDL